MDDKKDSSNITPFPDSAGNAETLPQSSVSLSSLQARYNELEQSRVNSLANLHAHNGAIEEIRRLIEMLTKVDEPVSGP